MHKEIHYVTDNSLKTQVHNPRHAHMQTHTLHTTHLLIASFYKTLLLYEAVDALT